MQASTQVESFFDPQSGTFTHVAYDRGTAAIIDPVLDYEANSGRTATLLAQKVVEFVRRQRLEVAWILETHAHADHLTAASFLRRAVGGKIAIGEHIREVQAIFADLYHLGPDFQADGHQFDHLFSHDETFAVGTLPAQALYVPGHTPADVAYRIGDVVFVGDTLFMPDVGTARCDFPGGDAATLYRSIHRLLALPDETRLYLCHDYPPNGRAPRPQCTVAEQRARNIHVHNGVGEASFVAMRTARDKTLDMPTLILPAVQVNIRAGALPEPESNGRRYLKIPLDTI